MKKDLALIIGLSIGFFFSVCCTSQAKIECLHYKRVEVVFLYDSIQVYTKWVKVCDTITLQKVKKLPEAKQDTVSIDTKEIIKS